MIKRRILYLIAALLIAFLFYQFNNTTTVLEEPDPLSQRALISEFQEMEESYLPDGLSVAGWKSRAILFPAEFSGAQNNAFYVIIENEEQEQSYTLFFYIRKVVEADSTHLEYYLRDTWADTPIPEESLQYIRFDYQQNQFVS